MSILNDDNRTSNSHVDNNHWKRIREAHQTGELNRKNSLVQSDLKRKRRQAATDLSSASTKAAKTCPKYQFQQLVERVRELQKEIVPDFLLYQMPTAYAPFAAVTPNSTMSRGSISNYPYQQSISISSGSSSSSIPNQRLGLSPRMLERAHQIPERFWLDWQQKQMQDQLEELQYIKNNIGCSPNTSLLSNDIDENRIDVLKLNHRTSYDELCRQSLLFLQEAKRLANERRASLVRTGTFDENILETTENTLEDLDEDDHHSFAFDQRSEETIDTAQINEFHEIPSDPPSPIVPIEKLQANFDRSYSTISLPFTYNNVRDSTIVHNNNRQASIEPILEKVIEVNDAATQTTSPSNNIDDVAQIDTELCFTFIKRELPGQSNPILYAKAIINRSVEFRKFQPISCHKIMTSSNKDVTKIIPVIYQKSTQ